MLVQITSSNHVYFNNNTESEQSGYLLSAPTGQQWEMMYGGIGEDRAYAVLEIPGEGFVAAGQTDRFGAGDHDAWLVFIDDSGNVISNFTYGTPDYEVARDIVEISSGGYALVGYNSEVVSNHDFLLVLVDDYGNEIRSELYGTAFGERAYAAIETKDGSILMIGDGGSGGSQQLRLVKVNITTGNEIWAYDYGGPNSEVGFDVIETADGYVVAGYTQSWGAGGFDMWLMKVNFTGHHEWNQTYGGLGYDIARSLTYSISGGFVLAGEHETPEGDHNMWMVITDTNGIQISNHSFGGSGFETAISISQTRDFDGYVLTGSTTSFGEGSEDFYTVRTDLSGNLVWDVSNGTLGPDVAFDVIYLSDGGFGIIGYTQTYTPTSYELRMNRLWYDNEGPDFTNLPASVQFYENEYVTFQVLATEYSGYRYWQLNDTKFSITNIGLITNSTPLDIGVYPVHVVAMDKYYNMNSGDVIFTIEEETATTSTTSTTSTTTTSITTTTSTNTALPTNSEDSLVLGWLIMGIGVGSAGLALASLAILKKGPFKLKDRK